MSICVNCYHTFYHKTEHEVGQLWNIEPYMAAVCSDKCKDEIEKKVADGTWMTARTFPKTKNDDSLPKAITDKQFGV